MSNVVKWGILGNAGIARNYVIPALSAAKNCELYAVASRNDVDPALYPGIKLYNGYDNLLNDETVQAVYIPLPNALHCEWTIKALKMGKHVLCEKPISMNAAECERMIAAANENGTLLMEAFMYRFSAKTRKVQELLAAGRIGRLRSIRAHFGYKKNFASAARDKRELGGGSLYDIGCYCVDGINHLMRAQGASFEDCSATFRMDGDVDQYASAWLRYSGDVLCTLDCWFDVASHQSLMLLGDQGALDVPEAFRGTPESIILYTAGGQQVIPVEETESYTLEVEAFADAILGNRQEIIPLECSLMNMQVMDALLRYRP
jgi:D-xylose 1-dehydrogenase (NADP+, D-xylono-1,5-lactone-forming)